MPSVPTLAEQRETDHRAAAGVRGRARSAAALPAGARPAAVPTLGQLPFALVRAQRKTSEMWVRASG